MVNGRCVAWQRDGRGSVQCVEVEKTSRSTGLASALRLRPENICSVETLLFLIRNGIRKRTRQVYETSSPPLNISQSAFASL